MSIEWEYEQIMTKKQLIIDSAIELFANKGIEATSVQQITEHCGISKGAFYLSFKSKDELVLAIIDYFMKNIIMQIDQSVNGTQDKQQRLYNYYVTTFNTLAEYAGFAHILMKEQIATIGEEFFEKVVMYERMSDEVLKHILIDLYGDDIEATQYDLILLIKGFIKSYAQVLFTAGQTIQVDLLAKSLIEKTDLLAVHSKIPYLTQFIEPFSCSNSNFSKEEILTELNQLADYVTDELEQQSIQLLKEELDAEPPRQAILLGMIANIQHNQKAAWCSYMIKKYIENLK